jgi:hypothetical protein
VSAELPKKQLGGMPAGMAQRNSRKMTAVASKIVSCKIKGF